MTQVIKLSRIKNQGQSAAFKDCNALFEQGAEIELDRGDILFNGPSHQVYLVVKGMIKVSCSYQGEEVTEGFCQSGDLINCEAIQPLHTKSTTTIALFQRTVVRRLPAHQVWKVVMESPHLQEFFFSQLIEQNRRFRDLLLRLSTLSAEQRIIHFLLEYAQRCGRQVGLETVLKPMLTHKEIGQFAGTGRQTATTLLNKLRRTGILHFTRSYLIIRDMEALHGLSDSPYGNF
ncbi:Crp/Fnr family transcriptional regulator [Phaeodactylibacter xiamenensis]|uniref:Crp/Fnr family transcriptional regulator n=1 Tax=Phaeodactylibacter xiamenensis TaxID=1524460 RepID=UPI0024A97DAD|nr:Crp/Fnr family transcriptional regulator [Phaeodactylibacter xiamenensis]